MSLSSTLSNIISIIHNHISQLNSDHIQPKSSNNNNSQIQLLSLLESYSNHIKLVNSNVRIQNDSITISYTFSPTQKPENPKFTIREIEDQKISEELLVNQNIITSKQDNINSIQAQVPSSPTNSNSSIESPVAKFSRSENPEIQKIKPEIQILAARKKKKKNKKKRKGANPALQFKDKPEECENQEEKYDKENHREKPFNFFQEMKQALSKPGTINLPVIKTGKLTAWGTPELTYDTGENIPTFGPEDTDAALQYLKSLKQKSNLKIEHNNNSISQTPETKTSSNVNDFDYDAYYPEISPGNFDSDPDLF